MHGGKFVGRAVLTWKTETAEDLRVRSNSTRRSTLLAKQPRTPVAGWLSLSVAASIGTIETLVWGSQVVEMPLLFKLAGGTGKGVEKLG